MSDYLPYSTQEQAFEAKGLNLNNPAMTSIDFADQMVRNSQNQQQQAALIQQAQELAKQRALQTSQAQSAAALGVNSEMKNFFTVDEAVAYLKAAGIDDDQIKAFTDALGDKQSVSGVALDTIIRKKELSVKTSVMGKKFTTNQDIAVPEGVDPKDIGLIADPNKPGFAHVPSDGEYQVAIDSSSGEPVRFIPLGESPDETEKLAIKDQQLADKQWSDLNKELNKFIRSSRGNALTQAAQRAVRALNELGEGQPLTAQMLSFIQKDISGIFQGGVPPISGMESEDFTNVLQKVNQLIAKYTGVQGYLHHDLGDQRQYLLGLLMRLRQSTTDMLKSALASNAEGYRTIIDKNPEQWQKMIDEKMQAVQAGLSSNAQTTLDAMKETPQGNLPPAMLPTNVVAPTSAPVAAGPDIHALANMLGLKKKVQ